MSSLKYTQLRQTKTSENQIVSSNNKVRADQQYVLFLVDLPKMHFTIRSSHSS